MIVSTSIVAMMVLSGTGAYAFNSHVQEQKRQQSVEQTLSSLYRNVDGLTEGKIQSVKAKIAKVKNEEKKREFSEDLRDLSAMFKISTLVNSLMDDKQVIKDGVTLKQINDAKSKLENIKTIDKSFYEKQKGLLDIVIAQYEDIQKAQKAVSALEKQPKESRYKASKALVEKIKNEKTKQELSKKLAAVYKTIEEEKAKAKALAEAKKREQTKLAQATQKSSTNSTSGKVGSSSYSDSSTSSSKSTSKSSSSKSSSSSAKSSVKSSSSKSSSSTNSKSTASSTKQQGSSSSKSSSKSKPQSKDPYAGGSDWDKFGKFVESSEWEKVDSGYMDGEHGHTWESWKTK
ncbi:hypothetical protein P4S94_13145 [Aeribacillus composti]|uniref:hypothetical protein n=1 Tax=Aeribacillus composti TaxID=1868734 RepID=UPI002E1E1863|nr:hypothetical protein [Aeribacillus composti]